MTIGFILILAVAIIAMSEFSLALSENHYGMADRVGMIAMWTAITFLIVWVEPCQTR